MLVNKSMQVYLFHYVKKDKLTLCGLITNKTIVYYKMWWVSILCIQKQHIKIFDFETACFVSFGTI